MPLQSETLIRSLLGRPATRPGHSSMADWFAYFCTNTADIHLCIDQAIVGGRISNNMSFAFAAGYQSAIQSLFKPETRQLASLCVSEKHEGKHGNHPRLIQSSLTQQNDQRSLNGSKSFITGACEAEFLYIACSTGSNKDHRPNIKMLALPANQPGIQISETAKLSFVPEVSHGEACFSDVIIANQQILPGDGYLDYIKPFRTIEDIHVFAAVLGFLLGQAMDSNWQHSSIERILSLLVTLRTIGHMPGNQASTHLVLAGCRSQMESLIAETDDEFKQLSPESYADWQRDKALLSIASKAHQARTQKAWMQF